MTSIGGGASAHIHEAVVHRKKWLSEDAFLEALIIARSLPGTNVSNLASFVGCLLGGPRGALAAVAGVVLPGAAIVLALAAAYVRVAVLDSYAVQGALRGLSVGAIGVMLSLVVQAARAGWSSRGGLILGIAAFAGVALLHLNVLWVLLALLPVASFVNRRSG